jgi:hypothetical protein
LTESAEEGVQDILSRRAESWLAGAGIPSGHVTAFGIQVALMARRFVARPLALVHVHLAIVALETSATRALVGTDASTAILARSITHGCKKWQNQKVGEFRQNGCDFVSSRR